MSEPPLALAKVFVDNDGNRGVHGRRADLAVRAEGTPGAPRDPACFVISEHFREYAETQLEVIARDWEPELGRPVRRILDAGCGPGVTSLALSKRYQDAHVLGVDVEAPAIALAERLATDQPRCSFALGRLEDLPVELERFDLIQCRAVVEHVYDPEDVLHRLLHLLNPGGVLFVETPNYFYPWEPHVRVPMLPKSPKFLVKLLCWLGRRDPAFVDHLNFACDPLTMRRWASTAGVELDVIDLVERKTRRILLEHSEAPVVARRAALAKLLSRSSIISRLVLLLVRHAPISPSVMLLLRRRA